VLLSAQDTLKRLSALMKKPGVKKRPFVVHSIADALTCAKNIESANLAPIFLTSAVTGKGLDFLRCFLNLLPQVRPTPAHCTTHLTSPACFESPAHEYALLKALVVDVCCT
jgi:GTPase